MKKTLDIFFLLSIFVYSASLFFIGFSDSHNISGTYGVFLVLLGPLNIFSGGATLSWFANPLIWFSWKYRKRIKISFILSALAFLVSLSFLFFETINIEGDNYGPDNFLSQGDTRIIKYGIGYYLWVASIGVFTLKNYFHTNIKIFNTKLVINFVEKELKKAFPLKDENKQRNANKM